MTDLPVMESIGIVIERELGKGGFADVFGGHVKDRPVAIKVFKTGTEEAVRLYQREVKVATLLPESAYRPVFHHAGVLDDGRPYFVMEWVQGRSLIDLLVDGWRPTIQQACRIIVDACAGLEALHELGLVHSDVKPGNILMADDGRAVIIDFGLVADAEGLVPLLETEMMVRGREFSTDNTEPMLAGTPRYFAPEQIAYAMQESSDEPAVDTATDVYALGAILYELVARRPLWPVSKPITDKEAMRDYVELRTSGVQPETPLPEHIEPSLAGLIRRCVRHDLRDRPRTAKDLRLLLRRYLSGETVALDLDATLEAPLLARQLAKVTLAGNERGQGIYDLVDPRAASGSKKAAATGDMADPKTTQLPPDTMDDSGAQQADMRRVEAAKHSGPPVWLYNAVWAALGAAIALAALTFLFDW